MRRNLINLSRFYVRISSIPNDRKVLQIKCKSSRPYTETKATDCWNCHKPANTNSTGTKESFFCSNCGSLQELNATYNYFSLFGLDAQFQINQNELTRKFREFQSVLHPDKFSNRNEIEQNLSADISSLVNKAYKVLSIQIKRAKYLLELKGVTIPEDNNAVDKEFLFEIMERNEEVEDANDADDLKNLLLRVNDDKDKYFGDFEVHLKKGDLMAARSSLILLRYYHSLETSIKSKLGKSGGLVD